MRFTPCRLPRLLPPQTDLLPHLLTSLPPLSERNIVCISSKVVAIDEGRSYPVDSHDKHQLISSEAEHVYNPESPVPLGRIHGDIRPFAGIDESNGDGHFILLPTDPSTSAKQIRSLLMEHFSLTDLGVVIVDSIIRPLRKGTTGSCIGAAGIAPVISHQGKPDLFGRPLRLSALNVVDSIACTADMLMGQADEATPVILVDDVPDFVVFSESSDFSDILIDPLDDAYHALFD